MWPLFKTLTGLFHKPRYRLMASHYRPGRYFLWDKEHHRVVVYFNTFDEAYLYIETHNIDCDQYRMFK